MPKYHVHLYPIVGVTVRDVEAESQVEAIKKAEELADLAHLFEGLAGRYLVQRVSRVEYADDITGFLVDEEGDAEHERSVWYDAEYRAL